MLKAYHNAMTAKELSSIIGYGKTAINNRCSKGHIKSFKWTNANRIPKVYLTEFLYSKYFRTITG